MKPRLLCKMAFLVFAELGSLPVIGASLNNGAIVDGINFPHKLAGFVLEEVIDNDRSSPGQDMTLFYNALGAKVSVSVYGIPNALIPDRVDSSVVQNHFGEVVRGVMEVHTDAQTLVKKERLKVGGVVLLESVFEYDEIKPGQRDTMFSHLYLTSTDGKFVLIRSSYSATDRPQDGLKLQASFVEGLCQKLRR